MHASHIPITLLTKTISVASTEPIGLLDYYSRQNQFGKNARLKRGMFAKNVRL